MGEESGSAFGRMNGGCDRRQGDFEKHHAAFKKTQRGNQSAARGRQLVGADRVVGRQADQKIRGQRNQAAAAGDGVNKTRQKKERADDQKHLRG